MILKTVKKYSFAFLVTCGYIYLLVGCIKSIQHLYHFYLFTPREAYQPENISTWVWKSLVFYSPDHINALSALFLVGVGYLTWFSSTHSYFWGRPLTNKALLFKHIIKIEEPANLELAAESIHKIARSAMVITFLLTIVLQFSIWAVLPVRDHVIPYILEKLLLAEEAGAGETNPIFKGVSSYTILSWILLTLPLLPSIILLFFVKRRWDEHVSKDNLDSIFYRWKWANRYISFISEVQKDPFNIDVIVGVDTETKEIVIQNGPDRNLNNAIGGSIGTGKTSATMIPILNQDMDHMCNLINNISWTVLTENMKDNERLVEAELEKMSRGLNGMIVVEPSNDLCQKLYKLALAHKIPEEAIYYINPIDPNSMTINTLRGPIEKAVESFTMMIQGLAKKQDEFFKQSQRSHLKHYLYLLKLDKLNNAMLDDLIDMYHDPRLVWEMMERVERSIPPDWESIQNRDERNHWYIVKGIVAWFRERGLLPLTDRDRLPVLYPPNHKHSGKQMIVDKQEQFVAGLRNILDDIASNMLIRRVMFGNSDFDIDTHLRAGGILLINTAMSELADLHNILGQLMISMTQNGIFRRGIWTRSDGSRYTDLEKESYHHVLIDELPEYVYEQFRRLPANSRKYKSIITTAFQSLSQMSIDFGDDFMNTFMSTFRHKMVYADVDKKTATVFSDYFGEDERFKEDSTEQYVPSTMEDPGRRDSYSVKKETELRLTPSKIMNLGAFEAAVRLVENNAVQPVRIVKAIFVRARYFTSAKVRVGKKQGQDWLMYRKKMMLEFERTLLKDNSILNEGKENPKDAFPKEAIIHEVKKVFSGTAESTIIGSTESMIIESDLSIEEILGLSPSKHKSNEDDLAGVDSSEDKNGLVFSQEDSDKEEIEEEGNLQLERTIDKENEVGEAGQEAGQSKVEAIIEQSDIDPFEEFNLVSGKNVLKDEKTEDEENIAEVSKPASAEKEPKVKKISLDFAPEDIIVEDVVEEKEAEPITERELVDFLQSKPKGNKRIKL